MQIAAMTDPRPRFPLHRVPGVRVRFRCSVFRQAHVADGGCGVCVTGSRTSWIPSAAGASDAIDWWLRQRRHSRGIKMVLAPEKVSWLSGSGGGRTSNGLRGPTSRLRLKAGGSDNVSSPFEGPFERIKRAFQNTELSISSYDTAWVAMVPSSNSSETPQFPQCVYWILENQNEDGSWGPHRHSHLVKDTLSSTLASVIALKRWDLGEDHIKSGINFVLSNVAFINDEKQCSPIGFNIIFPRMIRLARDMGLHLPMSSNDEEIMFHNRQIELERVSKSNSGGADAFLAYVAEGLDKFPAWDDLKKYQRKNGSLFDCPSTTAAALACYWNSECFGYLSALLLKFGNTVPARYPFNMHAYLHMVDCLGVLGISWFFREEITNMLDEVYRHWLQNDEEIIFNISLRAMAFRLLRIQGYDVSPGCFAELDEGFFYHSLEGHVKDTKTVLELYKASQLKFPTEGFFEKLNLWTGSFLAQKVSNLMSVEQFSEVDYALKFPSFANLDRLYHRRNIINFDVTDFQIVKTSTMLWRNCHKDILEFAAKEFNSSQIIYKKELEYLQSWIKENRLDQLSFARQKLSYCYFSAAATIFPSVMSDARISWTKNAVLTTLVDDFFDVGGSREELFNLIQLTECWDKDYEKHCCSEQVKIIFSALRDTVNELGAKASVVQNYNVTSHITEIWLDLMHSMMIEAQWQQKMFTPTVEQYLNNAYVSFALGPIILPALYFVGPEIRPDTIRSPECHSLFKHVSTCGRLLNDLQGFQREAKDGKRNSISLLLLEADGAMSEDEAKTMLRSRIKSSREELLRLVLQNEGSVVPRACKDLFWNMSKILHFFYMSCDGFTSPTEMVGAVSAVVHDPIELPLDSE